MRSTSCLDARDRSPAPCVAAHCLGLLRPAVIGFAALGCITAAVAAAQAPADDRRLVRGRVAGPAGHPVAGALIEVTTAGGIVRERTDSAGQFVVVIAAGVAAMLHVRAIGMQPRAEPLPMSPARSRIDVTLAPAIVALEAMQIRRARRRPARGDWPDLAAQSSQPLGVLAPGDEGSVGAVAASALGVGVEDGPGTLGLSVLGVDPALNVATLDGGEFGGTRVPRDAVMATRVTTGSFDATRPGAAGAAVSLRTLTGTNSINRSLRVSVDDPILQRGARALGPGRGEFRDVQLSAFASGPVIVDRLLYMGAVQLGTRSPGVTLGAGSAGVPRGLGGLDDATAHRLGEALRATGLPTGSGARAGVRDGGTALVRLDLRGEDRHQFTVTSSAEWSRASGLLEGVALPSTTTGTRAWSGTTVTSYSTYTDGGFLNETRVTAAASGASAERSVLLPAGAVMVRHPDATVAAARVRVGGSNAPTGSSLTRAFDLEHSTSWLSFDNRHYWRATMSARIDASRDAKESANSLGTFEFGSLDDLAGGSPTSYRRSFAGRTFSGRSANAALALGDVWRRDDRLSVQYGLRLDGAWFLTSAAVDSLASSAFHGVSGSVPGDLFASPRAAFAWRVGSLPSLTKGGADRPRGTLRGGIGAFRARATPAQLRPAFDAMSHGALELACVGDAVPYPDWRSYLSDPRSIPITCGDGSLASARALPRAIVFDDSFAAPRNWRVVLGWSGALPWGLQVNADAVHAISRRMPSTIDLNLRQLPAFTLDFEGGRPVFVDPASIVTGTGAMVPTTARRVAGVASVHELRADLQAEARQLALSLTPAGVEQSRLFWTVGYGWLKVREQSRGYGQPTFGDPREIEWSAGTRDVRHTITAAGGVGLPRGIRLTMYGRIASGRAFTPMVGGDVNGDGMANDRAFVFAPDAARARGDTAVADDMQRLLRDAPVGARACLRRQLGLPAGRSSCRAPWSALVDLQLSVRPQSLRLTERAAIAVHMANPLSGLDALFHGASRVRGWGRVPAPDPVLMYPIAFDSSTRAFRYAINPRFGDWRSVQSRGGSPFRVTIEGRVDIGPARDRQLLDAELRRERTPSVRRRSQQELRRRYVTVVPNPMRLVIARAASLELTRQQIDTLRAIDRRYLATADTIWQPVAAYLAELGEQYDIGDAVQRVRAARRATAESLAALVGAVRGTLTGAQLEQLPSFVREQLDERSVRAAGRRGSY